MQKVTAGEETANKRVALTPSTWEALSNLRRPGQTFDQTVAELISERQRLQLITDLDAIDATETIIPWDQAKQELGTTE
jgi:hypothetical protein